MNLSRRCLMKYLVLMLSFLCFSAFAETSYDCQSTEGTRASLSVHGKKSVEWFDISHSASSAGRSIGLEKAPFSDWKNHHLFRLVDFATSDDSSFIIALDKLRGPKIQAVVYFDNDDHPENIEEFQCWQIVSHD